MLQHEEQIAVKSPALMLGRIRDYAQLLKPNLSLMVVFSSVIGYLLAKKASFDWQAVLVLFAGGILVTGSANTINQILEKDSDKLMKRTAGRPLPAGRMGVAEAWALAFVAGALGTALVGWYFNPLAGAISFVSLLLYAFAYTPMKKVHPIAVFIGAIPGALPPLIGWVAFKNTLTGSEALGGWVLFLLQFFWQFPHFWAIGWLGFEEYEKAGIRLLPSKSGRSRYTGLQSTIYSLVLFPIAILAKELELTGDWGMFIGMLAAVYLINASIEFFRKNDQQSARRTMFASLIYLPVVLLAFLFSKPSPQHPSSGAALSAADAGVSIQQTVRNRE